MTALQVSHPPLRAILVSVDYGDLLAITLPWNRHHFDEVMVITSPADIETQEVVRRFNRHHDDGVKLYVTDDFYKKEAIFNKWLALENALDVYGRRGWLCIMDADVLWPRVAPLTLESGRLVTPLRRMMTDLSRLSGSIAMTALGGLIDLCESDLPLIPEREWIKYPIHPNVNEWAGYSQIFHAEDYHLGKVPWHEVDWKHCGGADSFFQRKWPDHMKMRPSWECLHLGPAGTNWMGRASVRLDGRVPEKSAERIAQMQDTFRKRQGKPYPHRHEHEKLK